MAQMLQNHYKIPKTKLDYSRSLHRYERTHTTNMLTGMIVPVGFLNLMPGDTAPNKFGFILQSAPLLGPSFDNIYIDIISVWCPTRLVMADHNEWLGDNDTYAWTLGNDVKLPRISKINTAIDPLNNSRSKAYYAEHFLAPHFGLRRWNPSPTAAADHSESFTSICGPSSRYYNGIQVIPFRTYDLIYNKLFRNENITNPVLFSKQSGTDLSLDLSNYQDGGGKIRRANRLKNIFTTCRIAPAIQTVDVLQGINAPVGYYPSAAGSASGNVGILALKTGDSVTANTFVPSTVSDSINIPGSSGQAVIAQLAGLTVNSIYYSIMLQRYLNKASRGRRPVEFYQEFFGIESSEVGHDDPQLLSQKRFKVVISRVPATANSSDLQGNTQPIGSQGAYSVTSGNGLLFPSFTATEYGMIQIYAVIRTQESFSSGIDRYLTDYDLLSTYLPTFDHIGEDSVEELEFGDIPVLGNNKFGYNTAWYNYRHFINDVVGIASPGEPLDYFTLARNFNTSNPYFTVNTNFIEQSPFEFDRMLQFPVFWKTPGSTGVDSEGEPYDSNRYQWLIQFAVAGDFARTMSKDSEQLVF